jgi:hypothetical protein
MAGTIIGAVAAPLIGGAVSSIFGGGSKSSSSGSGSGSGSGGAATAAAAADPFASQRPQYQQQLSDLMSGKTPFEETAGAKALTQTGLDAESAQMASHGLSGSGAEKAALTKYATGIASQDYNSQMSNLMQLSGAGSGASGTAGQILANQSSANDTALATFGNTVGTAIAGTPTFKDWTGQTPAATSTDMTGFQTSGSSGTWAGSTNPGNTPAYMTF